MLCYIARYSSKIFILGKLKRFGSKNWMLCSDNGQLPFKIISFLVKALVGNKEVPLGLQVAEELLELVNTAKGDGVHFGNFLTFLHEE